MGSAGTAKFRAEDSKAKLGTGGNQPCWLVGLENLAKDGAVQYHK
ncbi:hypothetical protein [Robertmurraya andreesenii]|uniref:Uncharacterized protein n=1 Tax=Anoxybacillus andreesenii TaxID=1325932 RepID=A0ABT9VB57_9BACL|nr:hypothetical protein [Robertmurraya andreesenii]MDQ0158040.1 hypothetical protein [Robertmurraya andreesenii]